MVPVRGRFGLRLVRAVPFGAPVQQRDRAAGVAPVGVGQPDRDLGQSLPQVPLGRRAGFPRRLEHLMGVKRAALAQQPVGQPGRVRAGQRQVVGNPVFTAGTGAVERPS
jgi:hypothetical protein